MSNMSYCLFETTLSDLEDCEFALEEKGFNGLIGIEKKKAIKLVELCGRIFQNYGKEAENLDK